jgi:hypothetical protein
MSRKLIITAVGMGLIGMVVSGSLAWASGGAPTASSATRHGTVLRFAAPPPRPQDQKTIDLPPHGLSLGDEFVAAFSLKRDGHLVGRALADCAINDQTFAGQQCTLDLVLQPGVITAKTAGLDRLLPHQKPSSNDVFAVTGGTGPYTGAEGTITIVHGTNADTLLVRLRN